MLPNTDDGPAKTTQLATHSPVAISVIADLGIPEFLVAVRTFVAFWAAVPETPVHKNDNPLASKSEIRFAKQRLVAPPAGNTGLTKNLNQAQLCRHISAR